MQPTQTAMRGVTLLAWLTMVLLVTRCHAQGQTGPAQASSQPKAIEGVVTTETVAEGLEHPWALAFLPDGRILVTERAGRLRIVSPTGRVSEALGGVPRVQAQGQGGLLDVAVDPNFTVNRLIYLSYAEPGEGGAGTAVARGRLGEEQLEEVQVIYRQQPKVEGNGHFGSRLVFAKDGTLFVTQAIAKPTRSRHRGSSPGSASWCGSTSTAPYRRTIRLSERAGCGRRSIPTVTAACRPPPCTLRPASSGRWSTVRGAATSLIIRRRERTTAGR
jgi:glucose/arabinose dehydrogenase